MTDHATAISDAVAHKRGRRVSVCIPAYDEAESIATVVHEIKQHLNTSPGDLVDELVVIDDGSSDATASIAAEHGAEVISIPHSGKGAALRRGMAETSGEVVVFIDADLTSFTAHHVAELALPMLADEKVMLVKPVYERWAYGQPGEGGRVTELVARPLLRLGWPDLAHVSQPLAGETALRRSALDHLCLAEGFAIELALLIDVGTRFGPEAIAQVDLGRRIHRNRSLAALSAQAEEVLSAALQRLSVGNKIGIEALRGSCLHD